MTSAALGRWTLACLVLSGCSSGGGNDGGDDTPDAPLAAPTVDGLELSGSTTRPATVLVNGETDQDADPLAWRRAFAAGDPGLPVDPLGGSAAVETEYLIDAEGLDGSASLRITVRLEP